jgi:hypothetical protein
MEKGLLVEKLTITNKEDLHITENSFNVVNTVTYIATAR